MHSFIFPFKLRNTIFLIYHERAYEKMVFVTPKFNSRIKINLNEKATNDYFRLYIRVKKNSITMCRPPFSLAGFH